MKKLIFAIAMLGSLSSFAQWYPFPPYYPFPSHPHVPIEPIMTADELVKTPFYIDLIQATESNYQVKCLSPNLKSMTRLIFVGATDKFRVNCPVGNDTGVNVIIKVRAKKDRIYIRSFKVKPYGDLKK